MNSIGKFQAVKNKNHIDWKGHNNERTKNDDLQDMTELVELIQSTGRLGEPFRVKLFDKKGSADGAARDITKASLFGVKGKRKIPTNVWSENYIDAGTEEDGEGKWLVLAVRKRPEEGR